MRAVHISIALLALHFKHYIMSALCFLHWGCVMFIIVLRFSLTFIELAHPPSRLAHLKLLAFGLLSKVVTTLFFLLNKKSTSIEQVWIDTKPG